MRALPFRQVHLDFHTSPLIPAIGVDFDADLFVRTLQDAHINSITVFAKCHHGYSYYPTEVGTQHPELAGDLLGSMLAACRAAGIRAPVYTTVTWDELAWATHPEWRHITPEGRLGGPVHTPLKPGWKNLCMNTGYGDYVIAQIEEVMDRYDVDGWFIDIVRYIGAPCVCATCLTQMQQQGVDPTESGQLNQFALAAERRFMDRATAAIRVKKPVDIFYNSRLRMEWNPETSNRAELDNFTHIEIESLPGGFWGYDHFPLYVRYFQTFDRELVAMTGRFHTMWGDFGGLRNRAALESECFSALAHGATVSIGDQLHPRGQLDPTVYARIGEVYAAVEACESWCEGSEALPDIGVITANGGPMARGDLINESDRGALHVLEQGKHQFQFIDARSDLAPYALVILPDTVPVDAELATRLKSYLRAGGKLLITDRSGLDEATGVFALGEQMGVHYALPAPFAPDYLVLDAALATNIEPMQHVCEFPGLRIAAASDARVLAWSGAPYFNRTWQHFCSHQYTPFNTATNDPVVVANDAVVYVARPLFREYAETARLVHKHLLLNCVRRLLPLPRIGDHSLPSTAVVTVRKQQHDLIIHLLHYVHQRRGRSLDVIEDVLSLHNVSVRVRAEQRPEAVRLVPQEQEISDWTWEDGYVSFIVPQVNGYQIVQVVNAL